MSQFLTIPVECRFKVYELHPHGIKPSLIITYWNEFLVEGDEERYTMSFKFDEQDTVRSRRRRLNFFGVCQQIRSELLAFLAASSPVEIRPSPKLWGYDLGFDSHDFLDNGYAEMVQKVETYTSLDLCKVPVQVFPAMKWLLLQCCTPEAIELEKGGEECSLDIVNDEEVLERVRRRAIEIHKGQKDRFDLELADKGCSLETKQKFGDFVLTSNESTLGIVHSSDASEDQSS